MPEPKATKPMAICALRPSNRPVESATDDKKTDLDNKWAQWSKTKKPEHLNELMAAAEPILSKAINTYAPNSSPAVKSKAKILAKGAFESFDPKKDTKLQTHLYVQLQPLRREAGSYETLHTPEGVKFDMRHVNEIHNKFVDEHGREPSDDELADFSGISVKRIAKIRKYDKALIGESRLMREDSDGNSMGMPATEQGKNAWEEMVYSELADKDKLMYDLKTGRNGRVPMSVSEIALKLKVSPGAVSQRLAKIDSKIREGHDYADVL